MVRAIDAVEQALAQHGAPVYVRHEIVHNKYVVESLRKKGAVFVRELDEVPDGDAPVIFSAHGVPKSVPSEAMRRRLSAIDATCPLVTKVHREAQVHAKRGRHVLLVGHAGHPEVVGTMGQLPAGTITLIESLEDVGTFAPADADNLAFVTQTTPVGRRHEGDRGRAQGALPLHRRAAQGGHLLRDDEPPGGGEEGRAAGGRAHRRGLAQLLELAAPARGRRARRLQGRAPRQPGAGDRLGRVHRHPAARHDRGAPSAPEVLVEGDDRRLRRALRGLGGDRDDGARGRFFFPLPRGLRGEAAE